MKIIIVIIVAFLINTSCSNRSYYKHIVKNQLCDEIDPCISYFVTFKLNDDTLNNEYLMPFGSIYFKLFELNFNTIEISNQLKQGKLELSLQDFDYDFSYYKFSPSGSIDSLKLLTTDEILDKYFDRNTRLKSEKITIQKTRDIIYILTKRKEFVYIFYPGENPTKHTINIFYGKLKCRSHDKMLKPIWEFI